MMDRRPAPLTAARGYFAVQAGAGTAWWVAVATSVDVRRWTLGSWDPMLLAIPDLLLFVGASAVAAITASRRAALACALWTTAVTAALVTDALVRQQAGWGALAMTGAATGTMIAGSTLWFGRLPISWFFVGPFRFRQADEQPDHVHLRNSVLQLVGFWTTFLLATPIALTWAERRIRIDWPWLRHTDTGILGVGIFLVASALGIWSCVSMALAGHGTPLPAMTARSLVVVGPYRRVRNPMAVAGAAQTVGVGLVTSSWVVIISAAIGGAIWNTWIRPSEEADLADRFGHEYDRYRTRVRCWVPRAASWHPENDETVTSGADPSDNGSR